MLAFAKAISKESSAFNQRNFEVNSKRTSLVFIIEGLGASNLCDMSRAHIGRVHGAKRAVS